MVVAKGSDTFPPHSSVTPCSDSGGVAMMASPTRGRRQFERIAGKNLGSRLILACQQAMIEKQEPRSEE